MYHPWDNSTIFYQQVKEVGINPNLRCHALRPSKTEQRGGKLSPLLIFLRSSRAHNKRETRF